MVFLLNGGLSDGNPNKRAVENGYHPSDYGNAPKYKSRKVSALRDFPRMCGPNAQPNVETKGNGAAPVSDIAAGEPNGVKTENGVQNQPYERMKSPVRSDANGIGTSTNGVDSEKKVDIQAHELNNINIERETDQSGKPTTSEDRENVVLVNSDNALAAVEANSVKDETQVETPSYELGAGLYGVQENGSLDKLVEKVVADFTGSLDDVVKKMALDVKSVGMELTKEVERKTDLVGPSKGEVNGREVEAAVMELDKKEIAAMVRNIVEDVKPTVEIDHAVHREVSIKDGCVPSPKNKFRTRRVSAIRDFPPYCGRNAPPPSVQESLKITSAESSLGIDKVNVEKRMIEVSKDGAESKALKNGTDSRTLVQILPAKVEKDILEKVETGVEVATLVESITPDGEPPKDVQIDNFQGCQAKGMVSLPKDLSDDAILNEAVEGQGSISKVLDLFEGENTCDRVALNDGIGSGHEDRAIVTGLPAAPHCPWRLGKVPLSSSGGKTRGKANKGKSTWRGKAKAVAKKTIVNAESSERSSLKKGAVSACKVADGIFGGIVVRGEGIYGSEDDNPPKGSTTGSRVDVNLPPFGPSSSNGDTRNRVRETLRLFQGLCRKILQGEESRPEEDTKLKQPEKTRRIDLLAAKLIKEKGKEVNTGKQLGAVPGVEVGDAFQYRVELAIVGIHRSYQAGIDSMKYNGVVVATSIVASGAYDDDMDNADVLIYSGQGGNIVGKDKQPEDQKLERGNLALWNSISTKNPVRVIRGFKETKASDSLDSRAKVVMSYIYDGLYIVEKCRKETGQHGKLVFMFELRRIPGQPELAWKELKKSKKSRVRQGVCIDDIAGGLEPLPICAVNTIDNEKPQQFNYIRKMMYPDGFRLVPPKGCDCTGKCSDSRKCSCAQRNGGEIPYNRNGAIVEAKPLVFECGPHCKCPPTCYNRVSQHGIKIQLEIFKTASRGWGVRSLCSIPSGSFICEYVGELIEDKEAELRAGSDEYLFDIGKNYSEYSTNSDGRGNSSEAVEEGGYTIDAANYGNIGRFINHSCSPNLYAQDVLYDHDDKRMPHVMLFAAENIPPLQELTYHYNYVVGQVYDSSGNIKIKSCYCGSTECTGRMY